MSRKDSNPRTQAKVIDSRTDTMNKSLVAHRMWTDYAPWIVQSILNHYCNDKLFCRFLWLHCETELCLNEVVFAQLVELIAWGNNMCFWNVTLTFAHNSWNDKLFVKTGILIQIYIFIVYMYMHMVILFATRTLYRSEQLSIVHLMHKEVVYMS